MHPFFMLRSLLDTNIFIPYDLDDLDDLDDLACLFLALAEEDAVELRWSSAVLSGAKRTGVPLTWLPKTRGATAPTMPATE